MIDMYSKVIRMFPELYTKRGKLIKREPKKYECTNCGNKFSKTRDVTLGGIGFGFKDCDKCGHKGVDSKPYNVWVRMSKGQIKQEDYILNEVKFRQKVLLDDLQETLKLRFDNKTDAIGTLVYFGYLEVNKEKRDIENIIEYSLGDKEDFNCRLELIR